MLQVFGGGGDTVIQTSPELTKIINEAGRKNKKKELPKYNYPKEIVTAAMLQRFAAHGFNFELSLKDCVPIYTMDAQRKQKKAIYGGGLLLSQEKAEECRRIREQIYGDKENTWELSDREREITKKLGREKDEDT